MYRRPLQSVLRLGLRAGQTSEREAISRALLACRLAGASPPCATRCRTLHSSPQFYNVKETPQHSEEESGSAVDTVGLKEDPGYRVNRDQRAPRLAPPSHLHHLNTPPGDGPRQAPPGPAPRPLTRRETDGWKRGERREKRGNGKVIER
ncbi:hypothetical protein CRUP_006065 [Coryphaenoides rupestris]|nr:hypothetical protein CRUP_006065 [Coryphaenoides rupestris]